ncbi:MAG: redoxin family protein [Phycisphaerales bacterium]|nr:redoxin family protein [Phycisphaerales bacterium]
MKRKLAVSLSVLLTPGLLVAVAGAQDAQPTETQVEAPSEHRPDLWVGDKAPSLTISEWVKGSPVEAFKPGEIYVVEFWATWCGPCIASMPHLSEIQTKLKGKGVTVIGVSSEDPGNTLEAVKKMVEEKGEGMAYTVAYDGGAKTSADWMQPAEQMGIPCSFVVDKAGNLAYIGHPMFLDIPLEGLLAGTWDHKDGMKKIAEAEEMLNDIFNPQYDAAERLAAFEKFEGKYPAVAHQGLLRPIRLGLLMENGRYDAAWKLGEEIVAEGMKKNDMQALNEIAWMIVDPGAEIKEPNLPLALKAAEAANTIAQGNDASVLDTLARVYWRMGEKSKAIETQRLAVEKAQGWMKTQIEAVLKEYEAGAKTGG